MQKGNPSDAKVPGTPKPESHPWDGAVPEEDLRAQMDKLQSRYDDLQGRSNDIAVQLDALWVKHEDLVQSTREHTQGCNGRYQRSIDEIMQLRDHCRGVQTDLAREMSRYAVMEDKWLFALNQLNNIHAALWDWKQFAAHLQHNAPPGQGNELLKKQFEALEELRDKLAIQKQTSQSTLAATRARYESEDDEYNRWIKDQLDEKEARIKSIEQKHNAEILALRARNQELERIVKLCGKELMTSWGREEVGEAPAGRRQGYRYETPTRSPKARR